MEEIKIWNVFEAEFKSTARYVSPTWDIDLKVTFTSPSGDK